MTRPVIAPGLASLSMVLLAAPVAAQAERYELGKRFIALETVAATKSAPAERAAIATHIDKALQSFFSMSMRPASRAIDDARFRLEYGQSVPAGVRWAEALHLTTPAMLFDAERDAIECTLARFYESDEDAPTNATLRTRVGDVVTDTPIESLPMTTEIATPGPGDHTWSWEILTGDRVLVRRTRGVSVAKDLDARLTAVRANAKGFRVDGDTDPRLRTEMLTARALANRCRALTRSRAPETDLPAARLLREAEAIASAPRIYFDQSRPGQHWVKFSVGKRSVSCRIQVPTLADDATAPPLVFALHGAGGSENLFFEGENGLTPKLCEERGWMLVATRSTPMRAPPLAELLDTLSTRYRFDPNRVFVIGHSMGAMQSIGEASRNPTRFRAIAALGGGGRVRASAGFAKLSLFIGVGERDFLAQGANALRHAARNANADVTYKEYAEVGHVLIVQDALPDVFAFFDGFAK